MDQRRTGCLYQAHEGMLKRLTLLGSNQTPPSEDEAKDVDSNAAKLRESFRQFLTARVLTQRPETNKVTSKVLSHIKSCWKMVRKCMQQITSHPAFDVVILLLIVLNTVVLAMYYHGIPAQFRRVLDILNWVSKS